jgi:hypothetical protein
LPVTRTRSAIMLHFGQKVNRYWADMSDRKRFVHSRVRSHQRNEVSGTFIKRNKKGLRGAVSNESEYVWVLTGLASSRRRVSGREFCEQLLGSIQSRPQFL